MAIDASIPLRVNPIKLPGPQDALSLQQLSQSLQMQDEQLREFRRKRESENALRALFSEPDAVDPNTRLPTSQTIQKAFAIDPATGLKIRADALTAAEKAAAMEKNVAQTKAALANVDRKDREIIEKIQIGAHNLYEAKVKETQSQEEAIKAAQEFITARLGEEDKLGVLNKRYIQQAQPFNPERSSVMVQAMRKLATEVNPDAAPRTRTRISGDFEIQEQWNPETKAWDKIGEGPRFAKQVTPTTPTRERLVSVKDANGRVVWKKESEAEGMEVGSRTTDTNLPKAVQQLGRDFEKAGLPNTIAVIENAQKITPELAKWVTGPGAMIPDVTAPKEAVTARQDVAKLFNITLKDRSGAAVTNQELERLKKEFGQGLFKTPASLINAINTARGIVEKHYASIAATHGKAALDAYNENLEAIGGRRFNLNIPGGGGGGGGEDPLGLR